MRIGPSAKWLAELLKRKTPTIGKPPATKIIAQREPILQIV
jgi:hypothetical protein